jgi:mannose-6-phosphate isomerase-like protein (cupin superfamily)
MAEAKLAAPPIRRVVTGHDRAGKAKVLIDGPAKNVKMAPGSPNRSVLMWVTDQMPCAMPLGEDVSDEGERILGTPPPENGTRFCVIEFGPHTTGQMHRTETVDYVIVISGRIDMKMDGEALVKLNPGDILIQRGTHHQWINPYDEPSRVAFVLIDAKPLGIGHPRPRE